MTLDDIAAILYLISIPVFIVGIITLIIQFIRKKKKKVPLIMLLVSVFLFVGCLGLPLLDDQEEIETYVSIKNAQKEIEKIEESIESKVNADVSAYCLFNYKDVKYSLANITSIEKDGTDYCVYGKVTVTDTYGDKYTGKFNGRYRMENGELEKIDLYVENPTKN